MKQIGEHQVGEVLQGFAPWGFMSVLLFTQLFFCVFRGDNTLSYAFAVFCIDPLEMVVTAKKKVLFFFLWNLIPWPGTNIWHAWLCATAQIFLVGDGKGFSDSKLKCPLWTINACHFFQSGPACYATNIINLCSLGFIFFFCSQPQDPDVKQEVNILQKAINATN